MRAFVDLFDSVTAVAFAMGLCVMVLMTTVCAIRLMRLANVDRDAEDMARARWDMQCKAWDADWSNDPSEIDEEYHEDIHIWWKDR